MPNISIATKEQTANGWRFTVYINEDDSTTTHTITVQNDDWQRLTNEKCTPAELVEKSFQFLLEREPKESILTTFDLTKIQEYFPEYEQEIRKAR